MKNLMTNFNLLSCRVSEKFIMKNGKWNWIGVKVESGGGYLMVPHNASLNSNIVGI